MHDITPPPRPQLNEFSRSPARDPAMADWIVKLNMAEKLTEIGDIRAAGLKELPKALHATFEEAADNRAHQITGSQEKVTQASQEDEPRQENEEAAQGQEGSSTTGEVVGSTAPAAEPEKKQEPEKAATKPTPAKSTAKVKALGDKETAMERGKRLLAKVDTVADVQELLKSISDELKGTDLVEWKQSCADRIKEVGK